MKKKSYKNRGEFFLEPVILKVPTGSTISTLLHDKINPKNCQVLSLGDSGFLQFFRVVSRDYGKPRPTVVKIHVITEAGI